VEAAGDPLAAGGWVSRSDEGWLINSRSLPAAPVYIKTTLPRKDKITNTLAQWYALQYAVSRYGK